MKEASPSAMFNILKIDTDIFFSKPEHGQGAIIKAVS